MKLLVYSIKSDKSEVTHYLNIDKIDHFSFITKDGRREMCAVIGEQIHVLNNGERIEDEKFLMNTILNFKDNIIISISSVINDCNTIVVRKRNEKKTSVSRW